MLQKLLGLPINASAQGGQIDALIGWVHLLMLILFVGWIIFFFYMLIRFRQSRNPRADHEGVKTHASSYVEAVILVLEIILLFSLSIPFWAKKVSAFPTEDEKPLHVHIVAQQFAWNVHYPGPDGKFGRTDVKFIDDDNPIGLDKEGSGSNNLVKLNQLHVVVNRPVVIDLMTLDVIHSLFIPMMRVKQDAIPGMMIPIYFTPTQTTDQIREQMIETISLPTRGRNLDLYITMEDQKGPDGTVIVKKGTTLADAVVQKLMAANITSLSVAPAMPTEIACAQLCGINHYRMKGYLDVQTQEDYDKWYAGELKKLKDE